ncbi:SGNH/GDSL hydrolase family protein [Chitinophaga parva]|nr:SGNH/GDSL hydrolase family protein [Chitinophaga parva]
MTGKSVRWWLLAAVLQVVLPAAIAQQRYEWHDAKGANGICETDPAHVFNRMPAYVEPLVYKGVWNQSVKAAGEFLHFSTTGRSFKIKYVVSGKTYALPHMPATGVSGIDLYAKDANGAWNWAPCVKYSFGDTCVYEYRPLKVAARGNAEFYLYLPLYSTLEYITVGVPEGEAFEYRPAAKEQPIVAYGTSIMQGAVASRPGMAWTNILERNLDRMVINLGFSGNGRMDAPVFDLMAKVDAKLYIIDCMPNLSHRQAFPPDTVEKRLRYGIAKLRAQHPGVPILLAEHAGGHPFFEMDTGVVNEYHAASVLIAGVFQKLKAAGIENIFLLSEKEIAFDINSTVEGTHPNDIGMMQYATAYEKKIREILHEPAGTFTTQQPTDQYRDGFDWQKRHEQIIENTIQSNPASIIFGNSIINYWGGEPAPEKAAVRGAASWQQYMAPAHVQNAGFGNDRIENVLWRVYHGELDHFNGSKIVLTIGTNNLMGNTDDEIVEGLAFLLQQIKARKPGATVFVGAILPRRNMLKRVLQLNSKIRKMAAANGCRFFDLSREFMKGELLNDSLFIADGLHPNERGYEVLGKNIQRVLNTEK